MAGEGCVYRRCGCVDPVTGRQFGRVCPRLAGGRHGSWYVRLELPAGLDGHRRRIRRGGYPSRKAAAAVLARLRTPHPGDASGSMLTVGDWLAHWLVSRTSPAASTVRGYTAHVRLYLAPYLGQVLLAELSAAQVQAMFTAITRQHQELGSPVTAATLNRIRATLRAALNAAIRRGLITGNPASRTELPRARRPRAVVWTPSQVEHWQRTGNGPQSRRRGCRRCGCMTCVTARPRWPWPQAWTCARSRRCSATPASSSPPTPTPRSCPTSPAPPPR